MILITAATGQSGTAALHRLLQGTGPSAGAALLRDPGKTVELEARGVFGVSIQMGDYADTVLRRGKP